MRSTPIKKHFAAFRLRYRHYQLVRCKTRLRVNFQDAQIRGKTSGKRRGNERQQNYGELATVYPAPKCVTAVSTLSRMVLSQSERRRLETLRRQTYNAYISGAINKNFKVEQSRRRKSRSGTHEKSPSKLASQKT